jgi:hypothetical protein
MPPEIKEAQSKQEDFRVSFLELHFMIRVHERITEF